MPTMAEQAGLQPVTMAESAGLDPVLPDMAPTIENAERLGLKGMPLGQGERFMRGMQDIGQGITQRMLQAEDFMGRAPDTIWDPALRKMVPTNQPHSMIAAGGETVPAPVTGQDPSAAEYTQGVNSDLQDYQRRFKAQDLGKRLPYFGKTDLTRLGGSAVATLPAMALGPSGGGLGSMALAGLEQGGAVGFSQFDPSNSLAGVAKNTAIGGLTGAVINPIMGYGTQKIAQGVSNLVDRWKGFKSMTPTVDDVSTLPGFEDLPIPQQQRILTDAQDQMTRSGTINTDQLARKSNLLANNMEPTSGIVTRDPGTWTQERNYANTLSQSHNPYLAAQGRRLLEVYTNNDRAVSSGLRSLSEDLPNGTPEALGNTAMRVVHDIDRSSQKEVGGIYTAIRDKVGNDIGAKPNNLLDAINELTNSPAADSVVDATQRYMRSKGMVTQVEGGSWQPVEGGWTVRESEALRQHINAQPAPLGSKRPFGASQLITALDKDVLDTAGGDAFGAARGAANARFEALGNPAVQKVINAYGELGQGRTAQNFIRENVIGAPVQDLKSLISTISTYGTEAQKNEFMGSLRAGVMHEIEGRTIHPTTGSASGMAMDKAIRDIGEDRLGLIFGDSPEKLQRLMSLRQAAVDATVPPAHSNVNYSGSGSAVLGQGNEGLMSRGLSSGINNFLPGIAHEILPSGITNAPQNLSARAAVNKILEAKTVPFSSPPNPLVMRIGRTLATGAGVGLANKFTKPDQKQSQQRE